VSDETGIVLTRLREAAGKTQEQVADDLDTDQTLVSKHERGAAVVGRKWLERYAEYYGVPEEIIDWQEVPADTVRGGDYFLLEVTGDSMIEAFIPPSSRVLVRRQEQVDQGDIAVVIVNGEEATIKHIRYENGEVTLIPANARLRETKHDAREVRVIGKVVQTIIRHE